MLNSLCRCLYFWQNDETKEDTTTQYVAQRPDICLDVSKSGIYINFD